MKKLHSIRQQLPLIYIGAVASFSVLAAAYDSRVALVIVGVNVVIAAALLVFTTQIDC